MINTQNTLESLEYVEISNPTCRSICTSRQVRGTGLPIYRPISAATGCLADTHNEDNGPAVLRCAGRCRRPECRTTTPGAAPGAAAASALSAGCAADQTISSRTPVGCQVKTTVPIIIVMRHFCLLSWCIND